MPKFARFLWFVLIWEILPLIVVLATAPIWLVVWGLVSLVVMVREDFARYERHHNA